MLLTTFLLACRAPEVEDTDDTDTGTIDTGPWRVTILHTNDWQSHLVGIGPNAAYSPSTTGDDDTRGGIARTKTKVDEIRDAIGHDVLLFDAGDWMAGALFQELRESHAAELRTLQMLDYDAVTLGNHEFDWGPDTVGRMITLADATGEPVPIVASNTVPDPTDSGDDVLEAHFASGRIQPTRVIELPSGLRVGLLGLLGDGAAQVTPAATPTTFTPSAEAAPAAVADLEAQDVDVIVAITHAGVDEDEDIARAAPGIDVIIGGHSHTPLTTTRTVGTTTIVQAGYHTKWLGQLDLVFDPADDSLVVEAYTLHEIDDTIPGDPDVITLVDGFVEALDAGPLADLGHTFAEPVMEIPGTIPDRSCEESPIGNLITDAYRAVLTDLDPSDPIDVAFEGQGLIRESLYAGEGGVQGFSDAFNVLPLGSGADGEPGYSLVHFWVTGAELRDACEVTATIAPDYGCSYWIELSGARCTMNMGFPESIRVLSVEIWDGTAYVPIDVSGSDPTLYHVAVDSYIANLMSLLDPLSGGALVVEPKDEDGVPYATADEMVFDADASTPGVQEMKLWEALLLYAETFPDDDGDGLPQVPASYLTAEGRVVGYE